MLIGIDAHSLEKNRTGVGRVLFCLLKEWALRQAQGKPIIKFILYFKDEIPSDLPRADFFESKLLKVGSTAKFIHWDLCRLAKKDKVDILFCPGYVAPIFYQGKIALTLHDIFYEAQPQYFNWQGPADRILLKWVSKKSAQKAKIIFVPSEFTKKEVMRLYYINEERIVLAPLAAEDDVAGGPVDRNYLKNKFNITGNFILYVGSIFDRRHLPEIFRSFGKIGAQFRDYQLIIRGKDFTKEKNIDSQIKVVNKNLNREAILQFDFFRDSDLKLLYSVCAFFIYLSDYEGFGLPVLEAMNAGAPVITSCSNSLREIAGQAAILIKDNSNVEEISAAMEQLIKDENLRKELIQKGREQAAKFSWKECAEKTLEALVKTF